MNHYIYFVEGDNAKEYLGGTNNVGVWADTQEQADVKVARYFAKGTKITLVAKHKLHGQIGSLY